MKRSEVNLSKLTPMMKQYIEIKNDYEDVIIFFRLGDFYEMFFEDAILVSNLLELTLTGKSAGLEERIPMCGIPHHSSQIYIEKLIELGYKVGICEQLEDAKNVKGIVKRDIVQIISRGTLINNESLVEYENNYIGNLVNFNHAYGLSYTDISTGELYVQLLEPNISKVVSEIVNIGLKEVIVTDKVDPNISSILDRQFKLIVTVHESFEVAAYAHLYNELNDIRMIETIKHLLSYIEKTQKRSLSHFQKAIVREQNNYLKMDVHTKRNLELTETIRLKQRHYSLIWLLDKTKTAMGSRLLKKYIEAPLINKDEINKRYDMVDTLNKEFIIKSDLQTYLQEVYDLERLSGRIAFGNGNARDLIQLKTSLKVLPNISDILEKINYHKNIDTLDDLYKLLEQSIYETPPISIKEGYLIKTGYNSELDELKELRKGGKDFLARFEAEEKERTGIKNLKIGYNKVFGYFIEVSKGNIGLIKDEYGYERKQTLSNCERYISPILKEKEALILNAEEKIIELEYQLFIDIRDQIKAYIPTLQ
ncbi:MAG: DNA mismatch repair protein MutS, partial [Bacilli bacterium]|nr:DNA mismatch repair protein MutS [Bacilli bacterium]